MVTKLLLPQQLHTTVTGMNLPARFHYIATNDHSDSGDTGGTHWIWVLILLLKLTPIVLAIAGIIYRKTRGPKATPAPYAQTGPVIAPWQPPATQSAGGYTPASQAVAPWRPPAAGYPQPALAYPAAAPAPASYASGYYR